MAEPRCLYRSMISLFTFDASKVSCVIFLRSTKVSIIIAIMSFSYFCEFKFFIFFIKCLGIAMRVKYVHQRQRRFQITLLSILELKIAHSRSGCQNISTISLISTFSLWIYFLQIWPNVDTHMLRQSKCEQETGRERIEIFSEFLQKLDLFHHKSGQLHYVVLF